MSIWVGGVDVSGQDTNHTGLAQFVAPAATTATTDDDKAAISAQDTYSKKSNKKKKAQAAANSRGLDKTQKFFYSAGGVLFACGAGVLLKNAFAPTPMPAEPAPTLRQDVPVLIAPPTAFMAASQQAALMPPSPTPLQPATPAETVAGGSVPTPTPAAAVARNPVHRRPAAHAAAHTKQPVRKAPPAPASGNKDRATPLPPPNPQTAGVRSIGAVIDPDADSRQYQQRQAYAAAPQSSAFTAPSPPRPHSGGEGQMTMTVNRAILRQQQEQAAHTAVVAADQPPPVQVQPKEKESE